MPTGSFDIDPGSYGMGNIGQNWTFAVNPGIELSSWGDDGQNISKWVVQNGAALYVNSNFTAVQIGVASYTFTVPTDGSWRKLFLSSVANNH